VEEEEAPPLEAVALKPVVQRAAAPEAPVEEEEVPPLEAVALKPMVRRAAAPEAVDDEEISLKPLRVPLTKPMPVKSLQRARQPGSPMPLVAPQVGQGASDARAQRQTVDSARPTRRLSPLPLVRQRVSKEAGEVQRAEMPSATTVSSSGTQVEDSSDAPQINLDDLARTIYSHVRRLFALERERRSSIR
jgi:hypothetical protein